MAGKKIMCEQAAKHCLCDPARIHGAWKSNGGYVTAQVIIDSNAQVNAPGTACMYFGSIDNAQTRLLPGTR
jgi:hypothetical protein